MEHAANGQSPVIRMTHSGPVEGVDDSVGSGTLRWLGVPFAQPPVGELRWLAPTDRKRWTSPWPAKDFAPACVQWGTLVGPGAHNTCDETVASMLGQVAGSEDCLYLNVWRPAGSEVGLPVLLFIHGGFAFAGYTADPTYDGTKLARECNAVIVSLAYRLGPLGWLKLPQLRTGDADGDSGNFGLLDILHGLRWVQRNIGQFGGDAARVTVMGQSAGAVFAWLLLVARASRQERLFQRLIPLSGGISLASRLPPGSIPFIQPASFHDAQGKALLHELLIADGKAGDPAAAAAYAQKEGDRSIARYLRAKPAAEILTAVFTKLAPAGLGASYPVLDGYVLPVDPIASILAGDYLQVPVLAGNTREEGKTLAPSLALSPALGGVSGFLLSDAERFLNMYNFDPDGPPSLTVEGAIPPQYLPVDAPGTGFNARTAVLTQLFFNASRDDVLNALSRHQATVWHYRFDWAKEAPPYDVTLGAAHLLDVPFLFGNFDCTAVTRVIGGRANRKGREALSKAMMASVAAFLRSGDPNTRELGMNWPAWPKSLVFDASLQEKALSVI